MIPIQTYIFGILTAIAVLIFIVYLLRKERLKERHAIWWILAGLVALFFSVFPHLLTALSDFTGFDIPSNMVFFITIAVLFLVAIQTSTEITSLEEKTRTLGERVAILELRLSQSSENKETK